MRGKFFSYLRVSTDKQGERGYGIDAQRKAVEDYLNGGSWQLLGEFVEVDPYRRIAFTWGYETKVLAVPPQSTSVEVSFIPQGESTLLHLVHRRLPEAPSALHRAGWEHFLPRLAAVAAGRDPGPDPWQVASQSS